MPRFLQPAHACVENSPAEEETSLIREFCEERAPLYYELDLAG